MKYNVTKDDIPIIRDFMPKFWQMIKDFYNGDDSLEYWLAAMDRGAEIAQPGNRLGEHLVNAFLDYEDEKIKREQSGERLTDAS